MALPEEEKRLSRRKMLVNGLKACAGFFGASLSIPLIGFAVSPAWQGDKAKHWIKLADLSELKDSRPTKITYQYARKDAWTTVHMRKTAFVVKHADGRIAAFSNRCTHLGCGLDWDGMENRFVCPCHGGAFDTSGKVVAGPPPRPLTPLPTKIEGAAIFVSEA